MNLNPDEASNSEATSKVCDSNMIHTVVLLAKTDCHKFMPDNEYTREIHHRLGSFVQTYFVSPSQFQFCNIDKLSHCLTSLDRWSGLILTSTRCVDALNLSLQSLTNRPALLEQLLTMKLFTVGSATNDYLYEKLKLNSIGHHTGNSETLSTFILKTFSHEKSTKPLLYPCSKIRSDTLLNLLEGKIPVTEVVCYDTIPNANAVKEILEFKIFLEDLLNKFFYNSSKRFKLDIAKPTHRAKLESWLNKNMKIKMSDNRIIIGVFLCTDCHQNIILGSSLEYLDENDTDPRALGLAMVPGDHIISIHIDEITQS